RPTSPRPNGRPDKAVTPHPAVVRRRLIRRYASYQAYSLHPNGRPDKAFTPHPAVVHRCLMRR
ncbi:hypothetical protein, partial [Escherichia marmotae]|uniref:hypothetical protein n=1 Tax=Escherichia marmotae TaxID=1499973 RepID=UPI001C696ACB